MKKLILLLLALALMISFCGCNNAENEGYESSSDLAKATPEATPESTEPKRNYVPVSWDDYIKINGVMYIGDWGVTEVPEDMIGEKIGEVTQGPPQTYIDENGNMQDMTPEDGSSYIRAAGTELFSIIDTEDSIAAIVGGKYFRYTRNYPVPAQDMRW